MKWWDKSWNPLSGCTPCSEGCRNCVALRNLQKRGKSLLPFFNEHLSRNNLGTGISYAVGSLGDLFHEAQARRDIDKVFSRMALYPGNRYFILTKRSAGMKRYFEDIRLPENIRNHPWNSLWLGVTVEDRNCLHRVDDLIAAPVAGHRFLCLEPLLEAVSIAPLLASGGIEWVIVGSESGEKRRPADPGARGDPGVPQPQCAGVC